jgi:hypothetical protein
MPFDNPFDGEFGDIQILMDARGLISGKGDWVKGRFREGDRHCLVDALSLASGSPEISLPNRTEKQLARLLANQLPSRKRFWNRLVLMPARRRLIWFNDNPHTKHEDVMALFDRTIEYQISKARVSLAA